MIGLILLIGFGVSGISAAHGSPVLMQKKMLAKKGITPVEYPVDPRDTDMDAAFRHSLDTLAPHQMSEIEFRHPGARSTTFFDHCTFEQPSAAGASEMGSGQASNAILSASGSGGHESASESAVAIATEVETPSPGRAAQVHELHDFLAEHGFLNTEFADDTSCQFHAVVRTRKQ